MKSFLYGSLLLFSLYGCSASRPPAGSDSKPVISFSPSTCYREPFEKVLFRASLDVRKQHLGGFLLIKKTPDSVYRIVFANEIGMTLFDFGIRDDQFRVNYVFEAMNRKILLKLFAKDFTEMIYGVKVRSSNPIMKTELHSTGKEGEVPEKITISNPGIKMEMTLTLISQ